MSGAGSLRVWTDGAEIMSIADVAVMQTGAGYVATFEHALLDVFGHADAEARKMRAARDAARQLVGSVAQSRNLSGPVPRFQLARVLFSACGEGRIAVDNMGGMRVGVGGALLSSTAAQELLLGGVGDGYAAGWLAVAMEFALERAENCIAAHERPWEGSGRHHFDFSIEEGDLPREARRASEFAASIRLPTDAGGDDELRARTARARELLANSGVDGTGFCAIEGVWMALRPAAWFARLAADAWRDLRRADEEVATAFVSLLAEAAAREVVVTHVALALSDTWELQSGTGRPLDPVSLAESVCVFARALGWGAVSPAEVRPDRVVLNALPLADDCARHGVDRAPTAHLLEGLARGLLRVQHLDLAADEPPDPRLLRDLALAKHPDERIDWSARIDDGAVLDELVATTSGPSR